MAQAKGKGNRKQRIPDTSTVELKNGVIRVTLRGFIMASGIRKVRNQSEALVLEQRALGKRALIIIDLRHVAGHDSAARLAGRDYIAKVGYDRVAVFGGDRDLSRVALYILRTANVVRKRARYFRRERDAMAWLRSMRQTRHGLVVTKIMALLTGALALVGLYGWIANVDLLKRFYPSFNPSNPVSLLCFLLIAIVLFVSATNAKDRTKRWVVFSALGFVILATLTIVVHKRLHINVGLDGLLFHRQLVGVGQEAEMSPRITFTLLALSATLLLVRRPTRRYQQASQILLLLLFVLIATSLVGFAFGIERLYNYTNSPTVTTLNGVMMTLFLAIGVFALYDKWSLTRRLRQLNRALLMGILVFCLAELLTGIAWRQSNTKVRQDATYNYNQEFQKVSSTINDSLGKYTQALSGFRAFFQSSDYVSRNDFHSYFNTLNPTNEFPGFNTISFIQYVNDDTLPGYLNQIRGDQTLPDETFPDLTVRPEGDRSEYYLITYTEPEDKANNNNFGFDAGTDADRLSFFQQARDSGQPVSSGPVKPLNMAPGSSSQRLGFLMIVPVYQDHTPGTIDERRQQLRGFVYAGFNYQSLFNGLLKSEVANGVALSLQDTGSNTQIYQEGPTSGMQKYAERHAILFAAGRPWRLTMQIPINYGVSDAESSLPMLLLLGGTIVSAMMAFLVGNLAYGRDRAAALADSITADLRSERNAAIANQRKDEAILSSIGDAVFAIDTKGLLTLFNPAAEEVTGYPEREVLGRHYTEVLAFVGQDSREGDYRFIERALNGKMAAHETHLTLVRQNGSRIDVTTSAAPIRDPKGYMYGVIVVLRDMTSERELEKAKDEFVSLTSHQLRTPLTAIRLFSEMLSSDHAGALSPQQADYADKINLSTERMIRLVGEILNVSRIELGELMISPRMTDLVALIQSNIDEVQPLARERNAKITFNQPKDIPLVLVDPDLLAQVVHNLLTNAIRYTKSKGGRVVVELKKSARGYRFSVIDNGIGIPPEAQGRIFERFYRADNAIETEADGTGLGLYLVKMVLQAAGCSVGFKSTQGRGTVFYVTIPLKGMKAKAGSKELSKVV